MTDLCKGTGYLAVYIAGMMVGNARIVNRKAVSYTHLGSRKIETAEVGTRVDIPVSQTDQFVSTADHLINGLEMCIRDSL